MAYSLPWWPQRSIHWHSIGWRGQGFTSLMLDFTSHPNPLAKEWPPLLPTTPLNPCPLATTPITFSPGTVCCVQTLVPYIGGLHQPCPHPLAHPYHLHPSSTPTKMIPRLARPNLCPALPNPVDRIPWFGMISTTGASLFNPVSLSFWCTFLLRNMAL